MAGSRTDALATVGSERTNQRVMVSMRAVKVTRE